MARIIILTAVTAIVWLGLFVYFRRRGPQFLPKGRASRQFPAMIAADDTLHRPKRVAFPRRLPSLPQLRKLLHCKDELTVLTCLRDHGQALLMQLMSLQAQLRRAPRLPSAQGLPRLLRMCDSWLANHSLTEAAMLSTTLDELQVTYHLTLAERTHLPLCMRVCLAIRLSEALEETERSLHAVRQGRALAQRLTRARRPMELLDAQSLTVDAAHAMLAQLHAKRATTLLSALEERIHQADSSMEHIATLHAERQAAQCSALMEILQAFQSLEQLDWPAVAESTDPLHQLLMHDPTGVYARMDAASRSLYRQRIAELSALFRTDEQRLAKEILSLCRLADPDGLRDHVGWYLLEPQGMEALRQALQARRGRFSLLMRRHALWLYRIVLTAASTAAAFIFLHAYQPLWMLPPFLIVFSCLSHTVACKLLRRFTPVRPLPRLHIDHVTEDIRTLIVLPATLTDPTLAIPAIRRLMLARKAFPEGAVDCLLLADYGDSITLTSSADNDIVSAARLAVDAVDGDGGRMMYLQRRRSWNGAQRTYAGQGGRQGALAELNALIVHGEADDEFDATTVPLSHFHRRYAYVLALDGDTIPAPDALLAMIGTLAHPLNERRNTPEGMRGVSLLQPRIEPDAAMRSRISHWEAAHTTSLRQQLSGQGVWHGTGLYRPDALLESTGSWFSPEAAAPALLEGELAGCVHDKHTVLYETVPSTLVGWFRRLHRQASASWQRLPWLLPHVKTPTGVQRNPLKTHSRWQLRQGLRTSLLPIMQLLLLLYAVIARSDLLALFALLVPGLSLKHFGQYITRLAGLPLRAVICADGIIRALARLFFPRQSRPDWLPAAPVESGHLSAWENWTQPLAAIGFAAAALTLGPVSVPGLILAGLFACFPLLHPWLDAPLHPASMPTRDNEMLLMEAAEATWRFFTEAVTPDTHFLPPDTLQLRPWRGPAPHATPDGIGLNLLSCLAARELGLIGTGEMCTRIGQTMSTLEALPLWHGLPYNRYAMQEPTASAPAPVDAVACGILCACLITVAQGLRAHLRDTADEHLALSQRVDAFAAGMELHRLFDSAAQLFATGADPLTGQLTDERISLFASEAQLLSYAAVMRRDVPLLHFTHLNRTLVASSSGAAFISRNGTAAEYLLPCLLLPVTPGTAIARTLQAVIRAQRRAGVEGMFGMSESGWWGFDPQLNYQRAPWGLPELALGPCPRRRVLSPYAAALCLPFAPQEACDSLTRMRSRGLLGRLGYFESIDLSPAHLPEGSREAVVESHTASHQAMLLCAVCNALTDHVLARHFASVPAAAAFLPLLKEPHRSTLTLPQRLLHPESIAPREPSFRRAAESMCIPLEAHVLGSPEALLVTSAQGLGLMRSRGMELTRFTSDPTMLEGLQFYLNDGLTTYRLADPALPGESLFLEGAVRLVRRCGSVQSAVTAMTDPVHGAFLHVVELTNLADRERTVDLADCLVPALCPVGDAMPADDDLALETARPEERVLTLTRHSATGDRPLTLCHAISTHEPLLALAVQTDRNAFLGGRTLHQPASLDHPLQEGLVGAPITPCASFRARLRLGPRGKAAVIFITRLMPPGEAFSLDVLSPRLSDVESRLTVSRLLSRTMTDSLSIPQSRAAALTRLFGPLLWRCQPHQGALSPLMHHPDLLYTLGLNPRQPLLTLILHSDACDTLLRDAADAAAWLRLMGMEIALCVLCEGDQASLARTKAAETLGTLPAAVLLSSELPEGGREVIEALSRVLLYESAGTLQAQLEAMALPVQPLASVVPAEAPPLEEESLRFFNGYGGFQPGSDDYVIRLPAGTVTPAPWCNWLTGERFSTLCTESGLADSRAGGALCATGEAIYLAKGSAVFTPTPQPLGQHLSCRVQHTPGATQWHSLGYGLDMTLTASTIPHTAFGLRTLRLKNTSGREQHIDATIAVRFVMGGHEPLACLTPFPNGVAAHSPIMAQLGCVSLVEGRGHARVVSPLAFHDFSPAPDLSAPDDEAGTLALIHLELSIPEGGSEVLSWVLGACRQMDDLERILHQLRHSGTSPVHRAARQQWAERLGLLRIETPEEHLNLLINRILPWQVYSFKPTDFCELLMSLPLLALTQPEQARARLLTCARHQYTDGDVQRRWQSAQTGVCTRVTGHRLLLPLMTCWYVSRTGDSAVLQESCPWLLGEPIPDEQEELLHTPPVTQESDSLYAHCLRALTSITLGSHGLPLMHGGDWHDGLNRVHGESVWLGMLYACALRALADHAPAADKAEIIDVHARITEAIQHHGWDGAWYRRAFFADDFPLGSTISPECRIDGLSQSWAVLALGVNERTLQALEQAWQQLYEPRRGLIRAFAPAFDGKLEAGRISALIPGLGENGGHSAQAAAWMLLALCEAGQADRAWELLRGLNPIHHGDSPDRYRLAPYALAELLCTHPQQAGRGLSSTHTSAAAWLYAIVLERLLGFERRGEQIRLQPMVPPEWEGFSISLQHGASTWHLHADRDATFATCDGQALPTGWVTLKDDGHIHDVRMPLRQR